MFTRKYAAAAMLAAVLAVISMTAAPPPVSAADDDTTASVLYQQSMNVFRRFEADADAMYAFYRDGLGFEQLQTYGAVARFQAGNSELKLSPRVGRRSYQPGGVDAATGLRLVSFYFDDEEALKSRLEAHGYDVPAFQDAGDGRRRALTSDPDGQAVELIVVPDAADSVLAQIEIGLSVSDLDESRAFYRDFVGLDELPAADDALIGARKHPYRHGSTTINLYDFDRDLPVDNGSGGIQYVVSNVDRVDELAKAQSISIETPLTRDPQAALRTVWLADPDGITNYFAQTTWSRGRAAPIASTAMPAIASGDWVTINRDYAATRFSPLEQINVENVDSLGEAWSYELAGASTAVPLAIDGIVYVPNGDRIVALDGDSGEEVWVTELTGPAAEAESGTAATNNGRPARSRNLRASTRGVSFWAGDDERAPRIIAMAGSFMVALDAASGEPVAEFGDGGYADVGVSYGGVPTIYRHAAIIGAATGEIPQGTPGNSRAFDVRTGEKLWEHNSVPQPGEPFNDTWHDESWRERSGTNMWAFHAPVDVEEGLVYIPLSSPAPNYYGGGRPGENVFGNSIVALDALTGEYRWHFQTVHHDLWDADMPSAGGLFEFERDGERVPAIAHVGKTSYLFVLDRRTGEPLIDVEERPVPAGDVPGEWYSPTQPFPVRPEPLSRVSFDAETDLVRPEDTTPEHAAACRRLLEMHGGLHNEGPFTPFLFKEHDAPPRTTIQLPGGTGGVNWGGVAIDGRTGLVFANAHDGSLIGWLEEKKPGQSYGRGTDGSPQPYDRASIGGPGPYASFDGPIGGELDENGRPVGPTAPCYRPPWARLVAVDPNSGEIVWASTLGLNESLPEGRQLVGGSGSAGPTVTAGGLVFVGATNDRRFRAFDARSGEELWVTRLPGSGNANPMSYRSQGGTQHVAIIAGNRLMAYALR